MNNKIMDFKLIKDRAFKKTISYVLAIVMILTNTNSMFVREASAANGYIILYLKDDTAEHWIGNDNAVIELVDNSSGHDRYVMTKVDDTTWSARVPESANNITFNRYNPDKTIQWNSWSAGGRDNYNAYCVDGSEYGHWSLIEEIDEENYFHAGDIVYLDISQFTSWKNDGALMYINFTDLSKEENNGQDINITTANEALYNPKIVDVEVEENIYAYVVSFEEQGATELRFWRGSSTTLWNCSVVLEYEDYVDGLNCVKVTGWNSTGNLITSDSDMDTEVDSDNDGLPDYYELMYGLDKNDADSDNDSLTDGDELHFVKSNPLIYDSLAEGISDANVDNDNDGLNNLSEVTLGTDPNSSDSDEDGLSDGDEVNVKLTDPCNADTDGDTLIDGDEIPLGFSPLLVDTDNDGILDCDEKTMQNLIADISNQNMNQVTSVSVEFEGTGYISNTTSIEDIYGKDAYVSNTVGLVGVPVEINSTSEFDSAVIKFYMDSSYTLEELNNLLVVWYDEENDRYVEQETTVDEDNKVISAEVNHFSKYMIVDKTEWFEAWRTEIDYSDDLDSIYDTVIAIDCSGSMFTNDPNFEYTIKNTLYPGSSYTETTCYRKLASNNFVKAQADNDQTGIVLFASSANVACGLTNNEYDLLTAINGIYSSGGTNFNNAINTSVNMLINAGNDSEKMILLVSDGESSISSSTINAAISNNIRINTVYIGGQNNSELLSSIAQQTDGQYFKAVTADELIGIYSEIIVDQRIDSADSDEDGIPDVFEISGMRLSNGKVVYSDPFDADTDNDGLLDGEEINAIPTYWVNIIYDSLGLPNQVGAYVFKMNSDPNMRDTDFDKIKDKLDKQPRHYNEYSEELKNYINDELLDMNTIKETDDKFILITTSLADILNNKKIYEVLDEENEIINVQGYLDDWYIFAINDGSFTYGLLKMREQEFDAEENDKDAPGVTISFVEFDISKFDDVIYQDDTSNAFFKEINKVTYKGGIEYSKIIQKYFSNIKSEASYLIAEAYVEKLVNINEDSVDFPTQLVDNIEEIEQIDELLSPFLDSYSYNVLYKKKCSLSRVPDKLKECNDKEGRTIADFTTNSINISNQNSVTYNEQIALLSSHTDDTSFNMFSAEVKAHSDYLVKWITDLKDWPFIGGYVENRWYNSALRADMAIGEETVSGVFDNYYNEDSELIREQITHHGEK